MFSQNLPSKAAMTALLSCCVCGAALAEAAADGGPDGGFEVIA